MRAVWPWQAACFCILHRMLLTLYFVNMQGGGSRTGGGPPGEELRKLQHDGPLKFAPCKVGATDLHIDSERRKPRERQRVLARSCASCSASGAMRRRHWTPSGGAPTTQWPPRTPPMLPPKESELF